MYTQVDLETELAERISELAVEFGFDSARVSCKFDWMGEPGQLQDGVLFCEIDWLGAVYDLTAYDAYNDFGEPIDHLWQGFRDRLLASLDLA